MKKILILILIILLGVAIYMLVINNIEIGGWKSTNLEELRELDEKLDKNIKTARELNETTYVNKIAELDKSTKDLKKTKETYQAKMNYMNEDASFGIIQVKEYKIEYLWTIIENYAKAEEIHLQLDLVENGTSDLYNLAITLKGSYTGITDFIYDIEKDDTFDFKIEEFKMTPSTTSTSVGSTTIKPTSPTTGTTTNTQTVVGDTSTLQATFIIKNVKIELN